MLVCRKLKVQFISIKWTNVSSWKQFDEEKKSIQIILEAQPPPATCFSANFSTHTTHKVGLVKHFSNHSLCFVQDRLHSTNLSSGFFLWNSSTQHRPISSLSMSGHFHRLQFYCVPYLGHSFQQQLPWCLFLLFSHGNSIIYIRRVICYPAF